MNRILPVSAGRGGRAHRPPPANAAKAWTRRRATGGPSSARMVRIAGLAASFIAFLSPASGGAAAGGWPARTDESVVGRTEVYVARYEDTLLDVARRFGVGIEEIKLANPGVDLWIPGEGTSIRIPLRFVLPATVTISRPCYRHSRANGNPELYPFHPFPHPQLPHYAIPITCPYVIPRRSRGISNARH